MSKRPQLSDEWRLVPLPAKIVAGLAGVMIFAAFFFITAARAGGPARFTIAQIFFVVGPILIGGFLAVWVLMLGYVYADAGRRGMSRLLWMLVVIFIPNALGFILYFLLRQPIPAGCPECGHVIDPDVAYCPKCGAQVGRACPSCGRPVGRSDAFCSSCGHDLAEPEAATQTD